MSRKIKRRIQFGSFVLLVLYIAVLFYVCFISEFYGRDAVSDYRYNLIPFKEITRFYVYREVVGFRAFITNLFGNVLAFMPFGFFVPILSGRNRHFWKMALLTFLLSLSIETIQLLARVGSFDVDDLILNTLGGILGYLFFYILNKIRRLHNGT